MPPCGNPALLPADRNPWGRGETPGVPTKKKTITSICRGLTAKGVPWTSSLDELPEPAPLHPGVLFYDVPFTNEETEAQLAHGHTVGTYKAGC